MPESKIDRIIADLIRRIESGEFPPGSRLPSRGQLAAEYEVSEQTARNATLALRFAGLVESVPRGGFYVRKRD